MTIEGAVWNEAGPLKDRGGLGVGATEEGGRNERGQEGSEPRSRVLSRPRDAMSSTKEGRVVIFAEEQAGSGQA